MLFLLSYQPLNIEKKMKKLNKTIIAKIEKYFFIKIMFSYNLNIQILKVVKMLQEIQRLYLVGLSFQL